ncbi:MAG TPA: tetratricopeptide repeat protein [Steroidobacteraceae bacterium]|nr:tetratricopeptide repeat protein [Steroidobacteraceae bacterium]HNS27814.1 tetratricopeptide repeat protein [Steroidobacteraceae bacterium]
MSVARQFAALCVLALAVASPPAALAAQKPKAAPTIKDLRARPLDLQKSAAVPASASRAMDNYRRFLELQNTDPELRAEALRRLGDLNLEAGELERMQSEVNAIDLASAEAIVLYTTLLKAYPNYSRNDQVLYQLARAYETTGQPEKALATLDDIVSRYPSAPQMDEIQFRRGEMLFSARDYGGAEAAYGQAMKFGESSPYFEQSLYKHGWSLFKQSRNEESLESFGGVLDAMLVGQGGRERRFDGLSRADRELVDDTLRVMAITFSYLDGAESLDAHIARRGTPPYSHLLYSRLGDLYVDKERYQDAASTYRAFVNRDPNNEYAPGLSMQAIEAYKKGGFTDLVLDGKREFVERYRFAGPFWLGRDRAAYPTVTAELKSNLKDVAQYHHATAQASKKVEDYQQAARWYRDYLESFPDDPDSAATNYLLAETLFESHQYLDAAGEYQRTAYDYPRSAQSAAAGYAALVALQRHEEALPAADRLAVHALAVDSGVRFATTFPEHPDSAGVLTRAAQDVFAARDLPRAITLAETLLARAPPVDTAKQRIAWTIIGQSNFDLLYFDKAEAAFVNARTLAPPGDPERADLTERLAASVYRQAEARRTSGDASGAVDAFLRVAVVAPDSQIRSTATYDAAALLVTLKEWGRAVPVLESFRRDFPEDKLQPEVTRSLAVAYAETGRAGEAAAEFERIAASPGEDPAVRREAVVQAADLHEKAGNSARSEAMLEKFVADYPTPVLDAIEVRQRLADAAARRGDVAKQQSWQRAIILADASAGAERSDRTRFLAAHAQLALAAPARDAFRGVRLVAPLKNSLAQKRSSLEIALAAYKSAADYRIADVTTSATFEMAELYRTLARDLMESERPKNMEDEALEQYDLLLEEQAFPFEEQAIAVHQANAARAREGVYNDGVKASYAALAQLNPGRYGKTELAQGVVDALTLLEPPPPVPVVVDGETPAAPAPVPAPPPARALADFDRAVGLARAGDNAGAALEFGQLSAAVPQYAAVFFNLGVAQLNQNRLDDAEAAFRAALERNPASAEAAAELGLTLRMAGRFEQARAAYEQALAAREGFASAHRNYAVLLDLYLQEPAPALAHLERYRELTGEDKPVSGWIAELRQRAGSAPPAADADPVAGAEP